ncbi:site-specific DNA-methyltransferase [Rhodohalobacter mucosus]|uniref:site-specific DNA-methyltransferase (adenine-specific) n=1 Tax=Rhodohalobacter mucosus TaxID=2079485 RepID=A0A316TRY3_9BACT|nr:site-specific DNA-methyltransferase [Rhodohalobacter mucosus]
MTEKDGESKDLVAENIEKLKQLFPEIVTDGKVDFETLEEVLGEFKEDSKERYSFTWNGKSKARKLAMTPSRGTLRPAPEESVNWDSTENLFIEGDNLEVLKLLQRSYHGKVKMIYIDPPYNTGNDFVYPDDYGDNIRNYLKITGQVDREGKKVSSNPEYSGRYHTDWLNMMFPRLLLARELLTQDGCIFISIDDNELFNLINVCNQVFGDSNFVANIVWRKKYGIQNDAKHFSTSHEYLICYAKNSESFSPTLLPRTEKQNSRYSNPDNDPRGPWKSSDLSVGRVTEKDIYEITTPSGRKVAPPEGNSWRYSKDKFQELVDDNRIWFGEDGSNVPSIKRFLSEVKQGITPTTFWDYDEVGHTDGSNKALKELFQGKQVFDYPKPVDYMKKIIHVGTKKDDLILDFFAGSASLAEACLYKNINDDGNRRFILVQLPEEIEEKSEAYKLGYKTISEIAKDRIRKVINIIDESNEKNNHKNGFKSLKLDESNIKAWDPNFEQVQLSIEDSIENIKPDRSEQDVLYEILLKYGLDLALPIEEKEIGGSKVFVAGAGALFICLAPKIDLVVVEGIAKQKEELEPELTRVVFRDSGFKDDVIKTNAVQILKQHGIEDVRSI